jgi:phage tail-like protein
VTVVRRPPDWLVRQLPVAMVQEDFFRRFVSIFQHVSTSYLDAVDGLEHLTDVTVAPTPLLPWLGSWLGVDVVDPTLDELLQRQLVSTAGSALGWRGTHRGVEAWLEAITGAPVTIDDPGGVFREGEAPMRAPIVRVHTSGTGWMTPAAFAKVVQAELPANLTLELYVDHQLVPLGVEPEPEPEPAAAAEAVPVGSVPTWPGAAEPAAPQPADEPPTETTDG